MELVSEIFPEYNPLPKLIEIFSNLEREVLEDEVLPLEIIDEVFAEAGVLVETSQDMSILVTLLLEHQVFEMVKLPGSKRPSIKVHSRLNKGVKHGK